MEQIEKYLAQLIKDPENDHINFELAYAYEKEKQYAAAISYYLRCAEYTSNNTLASECLIRCSFSISKQGGRDQKELHYIKQAMGASPCSLETYHVASLYFSWRGEYRDSYLYSCLGINIHENNLQKQPFSKEINFSIYDLYCQKAICGSKIGKFNEARQIYIKILQNFKLSNHTRSYIINNVNALKRVNHPIISYNKDKKCKLKYQFQNYEKINENFSQIYQDIFVLSMTNGKKEGTYLEVGAGYPKKGNNTFLLEKEFDWKGVSIDINPKSKELFDKNRKNESICADATSIDYIQLLSEHYKSTSIDYLQLDCDPAKITYDILQKIPFDNFKFGVITYEHDFYNDSTGSYREKSRTFLKEKGYKLICGNISPLKDKYPFEDWWIHPDLIDENIWKQFERTDDAPINGEKYMLTKCNNHEIVKALVLSNNILDNFILKNSEFFDFDTNSEKSDYFTYYNNLSGTNEYRLYSYLSTLFNNITILDIGTGYGISAIALSHNETNQVISYNIVDQIGNDSKLKTKKNIIFKIKNVLEDLNEEFIKNVKIVMIDIDHFGEEEKKIINKLEELNYSGIILLDDIHHPWEKESKCMKQLWDYIKYTKYDITKYGHITGTGIFLMNFNIDIIFSELHENEEKYMLTKKHFLNKQNNNIKLEVQDTSKKNTNSIKIGLDIGACTGTTINLFDDCDIIYAFEPNPLVFQQLEEFKNKHKNKYKIVTYDYAISDTDGTALFNIMSHHGYSSLLEFDESGNLFKHCDKIDNGFNKLITRRKVQTKRLDTFIEENNIQNIHFIKIDTQGSDLAVIKSLGKYIKNVYKIQAEIQTQTLYKNSSKKKETIEFMKKNNFDLVDIIQNSIATAGYEERLTFINNSFIDSINQDTSIQNDWKNNENEEKYMLTRSKYIQNPIEEKAETIIDNKNVAFWDNQLCERGTTVAMYDYAYYNQTILGNKSYIFYDKNNPNNKKEIIEKFKKHFIVHETDDFKEVDEYLVKNNISHIYIIKSGELDSRLSKVAKNCVHCVFTCSQPHGEVYSSIAPWVQGNHNKYPVVPHMVNLPKNNNNMREKLNIPKNAIVFGGYGGKENFNIKFVQNVVCNIVQNNDNIYFLFANFHKFCQDLPNIIFLPMITNLHEKVEFINTCDAMLWAQKMGEVMSMSMGEFSTLNKPIICKDIGFNRGHVHILKEKAIWYNNEKDLTDILLNFNPEIESKKDWNAYKDYTPEKVMKIFNDIFLKDNVINNKVFIEKIIKKKYNLSEGWNNMTKNLRNYLENKDIDMYKIENIEPHIFHWPETSHQNKIQLEVLSKDKNSKFYKTIINNNDFGPKGINLYKGVQLDRVQQIWSIYNMVEILNFNLEKDEIILEFGGGTGQMADVLKDLKFKGKHIVYELPLMICLQKHFIEKRKIKCNYIFDDEKLEIINGTNYLPCNQIDCEKEIMLMDNINFIATFSLTETDIETHKKFLEYMENFSRIYIVYSTDKSLTWDYIDNHAYILEIIEKIKDTHKYFIRDFHSNAKAFYAVKKAIGIKAENNIQNILEKNEYMIGMGKGIFSHNDKINPPKIIDCFIFHNELDLLNYRLNLLDDYVDYFVLVEAAHTHTGKEKKLFYNVNKELFKKFKDKIIHVIVDDFPYKYPDIDIEKNQQWENEHFQRNCIKRGIDKLSLNDNDIITICDLDEIPNPEILNKIKENKKQITISSFKMDMYYYNLNCKTNISDWISPKIISYKEFIKLDITIHDFRYKKTDNIIANGGWHLSYFGDLNFIKNKIQNLCEQEYNNDEILKNIEEKIKTNKDLFDRENHEIQYIDIEDNDNLPPEYDIYLQKYFTLDIKENTNLIKDFYDFIPCHDQKGNDMYRVKVENVKQVLKKEYNNPQVKGVNTRGYVKNNIEKLEQINGWGWDVKANKADGIYIKKTSNNTLVKCSKSSIPVLGTLVCTTTKWIEKQIQSIDFPVENYIIINNNENFLAEKLDILVSKGNKFIKNFKVYHMPYNLGCAEGWNTIIKSFLFSPYWVIVNDDVSFTPGFLKELHETALENPDAGLIHGNPCNLNYLRKFGSFDMFLIRDWIIKDFGLFDTNFYPAYQEDYDYIFRLRNSSVKIINQLKHKYYHGDTFHYSKSGQNTKKFSNELSNKLINIRYKNYNYFLKKWNACPESINENNINDIYKYPFNNPANKLSLSLYDIEFAREKSLQDILPSCKKEKNTFKIKLTSDITFPRPNVIVIDNFYKNVDEIREYALSQTYQSPENHGAVGYRCESGKKIMDGTKETFERLLGGTIPNGSQHGEWGYSTNGCFQWCNVRVPIVYHCDSQKYAGIIYLTPNAPPNCGTSFFRHKNYKIRNSSIFSKSDWYKSDLNHKEPHLDKTQWEIVDSVGNVYNRLVIFDAQYIHAVTEYFGEDINNSRLFQLFFFNIN
jgi:beta-1,4-mannosyl-glycoprotein beta-1,4-N-acetylglucosaminyltransferase